MLPSKTTTSTTKSKYYLTQYSTYKEIISLENIINIIADKYLTRLVIFNRRINRMETPGRTMDDCDYEFFKILIKYNDEESLDKEIMEIYKALNS